MHASPIDTPAQDEGDDDEAVVDTWGSPEFELVGLTTDRAV